MLQFSRVYCWSYDVTPFLRHLSCEIYNTSTLLSHIVENAEIDEHLEKIAENIIVEHLFYTIFIATNNRTLGVFFHCVNNQTRLTIRDTRVPILQDQFHQSLLLIIIIASI